jgi:hypothetical protein
MAILVLDTSVVIDLERAELLASFFDLPLTITTPDILYYKELASDVGPYLVDKGLQIIELSEQEIASVQALGQTHKQLSISDRGALVLAKRLEHQLVAGDGLLRRIAKTQKISVSGLLWVLEEMCAQKCASPLELLDGLSRVMAHDNCRLPKTETQATIARLQAERDKSEKTGGVAEIEAKYSAPS